MQSPDTSGPFRAAYSRLLAGRMQMTLVSEVRVPVLH